MPTPKEEDIKIRVPAPLKAALLGIAENRLTSISEVAREALIAYVANHGITVADLHESATSVKNPPVPTTHPVTYRKASKKDTQRKILGIVQKHVEGKGKDSPAPPK